jgi:hypothetical protein
MMPRAALIGIRVLVSLAVIGASFALSDLAFGMPILSGLLLFPAIVIVPGWLFKQPGPKGGGGGGGRRIPFERPVRHDPSDVYKAA